MPRTKTIDQTSTGDIARAVGKGLVLGLVYFAIGAGLIRAVIWLVAG